MPRLLLILTTCLLLNCGGNRGEKVHVYGAASTQRALNALALQFQKDTGTAVVVNSAASSVLARQIEQGAPADIYISANPQWMAYLQKRGLVQAEHSTNLLTNRLVIVGAKGMDPFPLNGGPPSFEGRFAVADPAHVPAGRYARQALEYLGWWQTVSTRLIPTANVTAALRLVDLGEATLALVYASDMHQPPKRLAILAALPPNSHDPICYPGAMIGEAPNQATRAFFAFLQSPRAAEVFEQFGFTALPQTE